MRMEACNEGTFESQEEVSEHVQKCHTASPKKGEPHMCEWKGCKRKGFGRSQDLMRHVKTLHLKMYKFKCPSCKQPQSRVDTLRRHLTNETFASCRAKLTDEQCREYGITIAAQLPSESLVSIGSNSTIGLATAEENASLLSRSCRPELYSAPLNSDGLPPSLEDHRAIYSSNQGRHCNTSQHHADEHNHQVNCLTNGIPWSKGVPLMDNVASPTNVYGHSGQAMEYPSQMQGFYHPEQYEWSLDVGPQPFLLPSDPYDFEGWNPATNDTPGYQDTGSHGEPSGLAGSLTNRDEGNAHFGNANYYLPEQIPKAKHDQARENDVNSSNGDLFVLESTNYCLPEQTLEANHDQVREHDATMPPYDSSWYYYSSGNSSRASSWSPTSLDNPAGTSNSDNFSGYFSDYSPPTPSGSLSKQVTALQTNFRDPYNAYPDPYNTPLEWDIPMPSGSSTIPGDFAF